MHNHVPTTTFWAKIDQCTWPNQYHPLLCHMIDVGLAAEQLFHHVFRPQIKQWLAQTLRLPNEKTLGRWLAFWIGAHDIGKASPGFQFQKEGDSRFAALRTTLAEPTWSRQVGTAESHAYVSTVILQREWTQTNDRWPALSDTTVNRLAVAIGGHHGLFPTNLDRAEQSCGNAAWQEAQRELLQEYAKVLGIPNTAAPQLNDDLHDHAFWMYVAGLTSVADWIGSNKQFFPEYVNASRRPEQFKVADYVQYARGQAYQALEVMGWLGRAEDNAPKTFQELFGINTPRDLQTTVERLANERSEPTLYIIEAPMGEGKTEAAWYVADCWDRRGGQGAYVALPTMATSNQMYQRVTNFLKTRAGKSNTLLLHGKAQLNERFAELKYAATIYDEEATEPLSAVVAEGWFASDKKHGLLAPFGVGTIDQSLMAVLQTKHVFVRLFGLAGKCIILDEVHAYDAYMSTLLKRLLQWLAALGCPVVLLSATLPNQRRQELLQAYAPHAPEPQATPYPRVTVVGEQSTEVHHVSADPTRQQTVALNWLPEAALAEQLDDALSAGGCVCVIRNTVAEAQRTYLQLKDHFGDRVDLKLFHARFPFGRRQQIESEVLRIFGKGEDGQPNNPKRPRKAILVATQVVEQSLDLDFDLMVSDLAPIDLVLQRAGRLWRHHRTDRQTKLSGPVLCLLRPEEKNGLPYFGASEFIYERFILLSSYLVTRDRQHVRLPDDLESLVEQVYGQFAKHDEPWQSELERTQEKMKEDKRIRGRCAKNVCIQAHEHEFLFSTILANLDEENPEAHPKIRAATRDADPNVQVIIVYERDGQHYLTPADLEPLKLNKPPTHALALRVLGNEVSLGDQRIVHTLLANDGPKGWRKSGLFRYHRLLPLNSQGQAIVGEYIVKVNDTLGVRVSKI